MANGSLAHERGMVWLRAVLVLEEDVRRLLRTAPAQIERLGAVQGAVHADRIAGAYVDSLAARALGYRGFAKLVRGSNAPEQALMKAFCSEARRNALLVAAEASGDHAVDLHVDGHARDDNCAWIERYFLSFGSTISAGSSEIQRNIIAERVLGLPRG
jgi:alkylation response protein AidB-like acyl-CoA dehydrogenase